MKKIIHILTDTNIGGAGIWLLNYLKSFDRTKYEVVAALPEGAELKAKIAELGIRMCEIRGVADESFSKKGIGEFYRLFKEEKPDIIHSHASLSARIAARLCGIRIVNTRHCLEEPKTGVKKLVYSFINNALSDIVIGVSKAAVENLAADGTKKEKLRLVYNGVPPLKKLDDEQSKAFRKKYGIDDSKVIVGIVARLEPVKNHKLFLEAARLVLKENENVVFLIVGTGSAEMELKQMAKNMGISDKAIFAGYQEDITEVANIIDINVLTSEREALSISLIEGMSIGIPAVATDSGGPREVIEDGVSGIIVNNGDAEGLSRAILSLATNSEKRKQMGIAGIHRAEKLFSTEEMANALERIYDEL